MKKIAMVMDGWRRYSNYEWIRGCKSYCIQKKIDAQFYVFQSFGNFSQDEKYNKGEYNITRLPDFSQFDGILFEMTNTLLVREVDRIVQQIQESKVPAVSLLGAIPGMCCARVDNYSAMREIVEHLVAGHGCQTLNYIGGPKDNQENIERFAAYCDVLKEHGIPVEEARIFHQDYEVETGIRAFRHFQTQGGMADAFVCANENIAVGLCHEAQQNGFHIPEDFFVTGFDNFEKASYYNPRITTVEYSKESVAYQAMKILDRIWKKDDVETTEFCPSRLVLQESCGCRAKHPKSRSQYVTENIFREVREIDLYNENMKLESNLLECSSFQEMAECFARCIKKLRGKEVYVAMNPDILEVENQDAFEESEISNRNTGYPDEMAMVFSGTDTKACGKMQFKTKNLLPEQDREGIGKLFVFCPIHFREREIGYIVLTDCDYILENQFLYAVLGTFSAALEHLYGKLVLQRANQKLSTLYVMDSLTGLYNRMAYDCLAVPLYENCKADERSVMIAFIDVDHLKYINDKFGHDMGNLAIRAIADGIRNSVPDEGIALRYGGDEFLIMVPDYNEAQAGKLLDTMQNNWKQFASVCGYPFPIEASAGYVIASAYDADMDDCINQADEKMYIEKRKKKAARDA